MKYCTKRYMALSWLIGLNLGFIGYHLMFKHLKRYIGLPLTFLLFFEGRNFTMKSVMDKIYFPI